MSLTALGLFKSGSSPRTLPANPAIARCWEAWKLRFLAEESQGADDVVAAHHADASYRDAMPALVDHESIRDFIACAAHGMLIGVIPCENGTQFLYAAQVALATLHRLPNHSNPPGRPKKITK
jgi:hypothetical protein